jgi:hypothetical protein
MKTLAATLGLDFSHVMRLQALRFAAQREDPVGMMFGFRRNRFVGSYVFFRATTRS